MYNGCTEIHHLFCGVSTYLHTSLFSLPALAGNFPPEKQPRVDLLRSPPPGAARAPLQLRRETFLRAARSRRDQRMPRWRPGKLLCRKVGLLNPQPWSRTRPILLLRRRQPISASRKICKGHYLARWLPPLLHQLHHSLSISEVI
jgi:hypothetical protein